MNTEQRQKDLSKLIYDVANKASLFIDCWGLGVVKIEFALNREDIALVKPLLNIKEEYDNKLIAIANGWVEITINKQD